MSLAVRQLVDLGGETVHPASASPPRSLLAAPQLCHSRDRIPSGSERLPSGELPAN